MRLKNARNCGLLAVSAASAVAGMGIATRVRADVVNVQLSNISDGDTNIGTGTGSNEGVVPTTYTPTLTGIPYAPAAAYDSADTGNTGTLWNSLLAPGFESPAKQTSGSTVTITYQVNIPLADSSGVPTTASLAYIASTDPNNHTDGIHNVGLTTAGTGTDGLTANPTELMSHSWETNATSEALIFQLTGLTVNANYNLYIYGAGATANNGNGGTYILPAANQGTGYNSSSGAYTTEPSSVSAFHSVFSSNGGNNPTPEQGLSWVLIPAKADANGNLQFIAEEDTKTGIKGYINGFQLDGAITLTPEPTSVALLGAAGLGLAGRRRRDN
jgi:hypothetical protein